MKGECEKETRIKEILVYRNFLLPSGPNFCCTKKLQKKPLQQELFCRLYFQVFLDVSGLIMKTSSIEFFWKFVKTHDLCQLI